MRLSTHSKQLLPLAHSLIAAGPAAEIGDDYELVDLNALVTGGREGFLIMEVTGDSASPHIQPGNLVFIDTWVEVKNGDTIAATINGLTCVKIFEQRKGHLYLVSANSAYQPREVLPRDNFHVLGVVKGHLGMEQ